MRITIKEIMELGLWDRYCRETGTNVWAVNEGLMSSSEEVDWILPDDKRG
jgi:hypothetical protein